MKNLRVFWLLLAALLALPGARSAEKSAAKGQYLVYAGTFTGPKSKGIYVFRFDAAAGKLTPLGLAAEAASPSFLAVHPNRRFLYAVNEVGNYQGRRSGAVSAFTIDAASGRLILLNTVSSGGPGPCYLTMDAKGQNVLVANYTGGSVAVLPVKPDGKLGEATAFVQHTGSSVNPKRQEGPHAHSIDVAPDNRFAIAADLGLDKLLVYRFDRAKGTLAPNDPPFAKVNPGAGPRHLAFHPRGRFAYAINEMQSTVTAFAFEASSGKLTELQMLSTLPPDFTGETYAAEIQVHPSGKFLYGSNRGHDSIAMFAIDPGKGTLTSLGQAPSQGKWPWSFGMDPAGAYLLAANQKSGEIAAFRIDPKTGRLSPTGQVVEAGTPVCVKFVAVE